MAPSRLPDRRRVMDVRRSGGHRVGRQHGFRDWLRFRGTEPGEHKLLAGAEAGEHYFLVCILGDHGELRHAIPQRYVMSTGGLLSYGFDGLEAEGRGVIAYRGTRYADPAGD